MKIVEKETSDDKIKTNRRICQSFSIKIEEKTRLLLLTLPRALFSRSAEAVGLGMSEKSKILGVPGPVASTGGARK